MKLQLHSILHLQVFEISVHGPNYGLILTDKEKNEEKEEEEKRTKILFVYTKLFCQHQTMAKIKCIGRRNIIFDSFFQSKSLNLCI